MPDFKNLDPLLVNKEDSALPIIPIGSTDAPNSYNSFVDLSGKKAPEQDPLFGSPFQATPLAPTLTAKELYDNRRYDIYSRDIVDIEDQYAQSQSALAKGVNGLLKGVNLAATTVAGGFGMIYGAGSSMFSGRLADIWDNPVMRELDEWNTEVDQNYLPNYYSNKETNANWYSTDNWLTTNFLFDKLIKNAGFAVGAMVSGNIMNGALGSAGSALGSIASEGAAIAESSQAFKLFSPLLRSTARAFSAGKNIEAAVALESELSSIADISAKTSQLEKIAKSASRFASMNDTARRVAVAAYSSAGEASFEALQTANSYRNNLINEFVKINGEQPTGEDLEKINNEADQVGKYSFFGNMALLAATEYVQLPYLLGSNYRQSRLASSLVREIGDIAKSEGKYIAKEAANSGFTKLLSKAGKTVNYLFDPKESAQELGQFALQVGVQNYFDKSNKGEAADVWVDGVMYGLFGKNDKLEKVGALNSKEGLESGFLGGITGGMMQSFGRNGKIAAENQKNINTQTFTNILNSTPDFKEAFVDRMQYVNRASVLHNEHSAAIQQGDRLEANDIKSDLMYSYFSPRIRYGKLDMIMDDISELKKMSSTEQGLSELKEQGIGNINDNIQSFHNRLDEIEDYAKSVNNMFEHVQINYGSQLIKDSDGVLKKKYSPALLDRMTYAASKIANYDKRIPEVSSAIISKGINLDEIVDDYLNNNGIQLTKTLVELDNSDDINSDSTKQELKDVVEMSLRRKLFVYQYNDMKNNPQDYDSNGNKLEFNSEGKKFRTVPAISDSIESRNPFKGDKRTYSDLVKQYGEGSVSKYETIKKIIASPFSTTVEKELASQFLKYTDRTSKINLGERNIGTPSSSNEENSSVNYEFSSSDYEGKTIPVEYSLLKEIGFSMTKDELSKDDSEFNKELSPIFTAVQEHFKNDENKYSNNGLIRNGEFKALNSIQEFAAEVLSNRDFQRYLSTIPYKTTQKSVWDSFVDNLKTFFRRLFGVENESLLDEAIAIVTNNIDKSYSSTKEKNEQLDAEERKIKENKKALEKIQQLMEQKSPSVPGSSSAEVVEEGKLKSAEKLFTSSITESEDYNNPGESSAHITRSREFLNNAKNFKNRNKLRAIIVTANQLDNLGLSGLAQLSYNVDSSTPIDDIPFIKDVDRGFIAQVFVMQDRNKLYFVNKNGEKLSQVGSSVDINDIVFQTMPTTSLTNSQGLPRYRADQKEEAEKQSKAWKIFREDLLNKPSDYMPDPMVFSISRGIPNEIISIDNQRERNHVGGILIPEEKISTQQDLIVIPTTGTVTHNGENLTFPNGVPVLQYGDTLIYLNNRKFTTKEAENIYNVINQLAKDIREKVSSGKKAIPNKLYTEYLRNILYWKNTSDTVSDNQIRIDKDSASIHIGNKEYSLFDIESSMEQIVEQLQNAFLTVNDYTLKKEFSSKFTELYTNDNGELDSRIWDNYQTFLLSAKYPDGQTRSSEQTPLTTSVAKPTEQVPYSFKQKYATLSELELPLDKIVNQAPKEEKKVDPVVSSQTVDGRVLDGITENTYKLDSGDVIFTASVNNGEVDVEVLSGATLDNIVSDVNKVAGIRTAMQNIGRFIEDDRELVASFIALRISADIKQKITIVEKKEENIVPSDIINEIEQLSKDNILLTHVTPDSSVVSIFNGTLEFSPGTGLSSTATLLGKNGVVEQIGKILSGQSPHRGSNSMVVFAFPKSLFNKEKVTSEDVENFLIEKGYVNESGNVYIPNQFNALYLKDGKTSSFKIEKQTEEDEAPKVSKFNRFRRKTEFRKIGVSDSSRMTDEELEIFKQWHSENVPGIPYEILENIITTHSGEKAWGVFENGVAKFMKGGLRGTEYHEIFEGVWASFLSKEEQQAIIDEFRNNAKKFVDRETGRTINSDEATDRQIKERIADDFSDFRLGKLPASSLTGRIYNFFKSIIEFFKSFIQKPTLKENLFNAINEGKFKNEVISAEVRTIAPEYRAVEGLSEQETHDFVQDMVAISAGILYKEGEKQKLFSPDRITSDQMFEQIKQRYAQETDEEGISKLDLLGETAWKQLKIKTVESLRTIGINFDSDGLLDINDENSNKNDYAPEPFSTDWKKNSTGAIKFSLATLIKRVPTNQQGKLSLVLPEAEFSNTGGYKLVNFSRAFATMIDRLSNTTMTSTAINKLLNVAEYDADFVSLFQRLGGDVSTKSLNFDNFDFSDWRYFIQFMQTFTKQKPDALIQYINGTDVYTAPANLYGANKDTLRQWIENIRQLSKETNSIIKFNKDKKIYEIGNLKPTIVKVREDLWRVVTPEGQTINPTTEAEAKAVAKKHEIQIKNVKNMIEFLGRIGVDFPQSNYKALKEKQKDEFAKAVGAIYTHLSQGNGIMSISGKTLGINGPLTKLAELYNKVSNPNQDSTYFGVEDQRVGSFSENNAPSVFENEFNESETLDELLEKRPELNDVFSRNSQILKKGGMFFDVNGNRIKKIKVGYIQGTKNINTGKGKPTSSLTIGERLTQEINQNLQGNYYIIIPADGSTEWMMNLGNSITINDVTGKSKSAIYNVFKDYLRDEIALALDAENRNHLDNVGSKAKELRFFKEILLDKDLSSINEMIEAGEDMSSFDEYIASNSSSIEKAIDAMINSTVDQTFNTLKQNSQIVIQGEDSYRFVSLDDNFISTLSKAQSINKYDMSEAQIKDILSYANINYVINNIEYHKFLFGDPYQFKIKNGQLDETKRIKSFLSPRRTTFDSPELNTWLNQNMNTSEGIKLSPSDIGYHEFKSYTKTATIEDVTVAGSLSNILAAYSKTNEADAASWLMDTTYREIKIKNGQWSEEAEAWHQWQMAYTRQNLPGYEYTNKALQEKDAELVSKPAPKHTIEVLKPIVSGNKYNSNNINLVLDKFSQMPIYYSMVKGKNLEKLYNKMLQENIGYIIMESGRKVGSEGLNPLYNKDGSFNENVFDNTIDVAWKSYGIQVETTPGEGEKTQTRGSQLTKLSSMDLFDKGVATSEKAKQEYLRNKNILDKMHENAYNELLEKLGVEDLGDGFALTDGKKISETLMYEMMRRELSDNAKDTIQLDENNEFRIPFEASPSYIAIRNILYSMVNKSLVSPTVNGGPHVQVPATMFETSTRNRGLAMKTAEGWKKISKAEYDALSEEDRKKVMLTDDALKFYTKEDPYCEVMLPAWFKDKINKSKYKTDEDLIRYLNSVEGGAILRGIGFRIPTQAMSSIEAIRVKGFLPAYMGSTVVVPSEITTKAGSDFDIDKLNMYLKAVYLDKGGNIRLVKYFGSEEATKEFYGKVFDETLANNQMRKSELIEAVDILIHGLNDPKNLVRKYENYIKSVQDDYDNPYDFRAILEKQIEKYSDENFVSALREDYTKKMYKKSLENEYYDSLEKLITLPENFERLIAPVGDGGLKDLSATLDRLRGYEEGAIKNKLLDRNYMTNLRHAFVIGKKWIGIAAVNITGLAVRQKSNIYIDPARFSRIPQADYMFLGDGSIVLPHNTTTIGRNKYISLSGTKTADGKEYISDRLSGYATSFVDVAKDPYILKIIQSDLVVGTFMFLESIGAGEKGIMFLNQPIISEYIKMLDGTNSRSLYNKQSIQTILSYFPTTSALIDNASIDVNNLERNIFNYYEEGRLNENDNAVQIKIFYEFLKYAKMAQYSFKFTQATNYDTTRFRSSDSLVRKQWRTAQAIQENIISSVEDVMKDTFIGRQERFLSKSVQAMGAIFKLEQDQFRAITDNILYKYGMNDYMSADKFEIIANKIRSAFLDYIIQTKTGLNNDIQRLVVDQSNSVASRLLVAKQKYPEVQILKDLQVVTNDRTHGTKSIKLNVNLKDAYDENLYTGMMRELKEYNKELRDLYNDIVLVSMLQGTYQSAISIKNIIPIEDYSRIVAPIIAPLVADGEMQAFAEGMFQRNFFNDDDIVPSYDPYFTYPRSKGGEVIDFPIGQDKNGVDVYQYVSYAFPEIAPLGLKPSDRRVMLLSPKYNGFVTANDYIKVNRVVNTRNGDKIDFITGKTITKTMFAMRKANGDLSLNDVFGYAKVYTPFTDERGNRIPLLSYDKKGEPSYVYKLINLYGDGNKASEYYKDFKPSVIDNGTMRIENEIPNADLMEYFGAKAPSISLQTNDVVPELNNAFAETVNEVTNSDKKDVTLSPEGDRIIKVDQFKITVKPDGSMFYDNGNPVDDQTTINKVNVRKELQDGTLRVSTYNNSKYFVLSDGRIVGSGKSNLGKESVSDERIKQMILDKATVYKKEC